MPKIRLLLVDRHAVVRAGLRLLLEKETDMEVVGEVSDVQEALAKTAELCPDVVLMDTPTPRLNGFEEVRQLCQYRPRVALLFLTMHEDEEHFFQALKAGAAGYLPKTADQKDVREAIRVVAAGHSYLHPSMADSLVKAYLGRGSYNQSDDPYERLTSREREILHLLASGLSNRQIAQKLNVSINTVHNHRNNTMQKLGLHSRLDLLKYALRKGIINEVA